MMGLMIILRNSKKHKSRIKINYLFQRNKGRASNSTSVNIDIKAHLSLIMGSDDFFTKMGLI